MTEELPLEDPPRWEVRPVYKRRTKDQRNRNVAPVIKHHALLFDGKEQLTATSERRVETLREMARLYNLRKAAPVLTGGPTDTTPDLFA